MERGSDEYELAWISFVQCHQRRVVRHDLVMPKREPDELALRELPLRVMSWGALRRSVRNDALTSA